MLPLHWPKKLTSKVCMQVLRLSSPSVLPNGDVFWIESRPAEQGRSVIVRRCAVGCVLTDTGGCSSSVRACVEHLRCVLRCVLCTGLQQTGPCLTSRPAQTVA
jgi:hypothetical protein